MASVVYKYCNHKVQEITLPVYYITVLLNNFGRETKTKIREKTVKLVIIQDYSGQYKNRQIINNKLLLIVLFGKLYGHGLEITGRRQTSMAGPKYIHITIIIFQQIIIFIKTISTLSLKISKWEQKLSL